jgi:hypothetical protein
MPAKLPFITTKHNIQAKCRYENRPSLTLTSPHLTAAALDRYTFPSYVSVTLPRPCRRAYSCVRSFPPKAGSRCMHKSKVPQSIQSYCMMDGWMYARGCMSSIPLIIKPADTSVKHVHVGRIVMTHTALHRVTCKLSLTRPHSDGHGHEPPCLPVGPQRLAGQRIN